MLSDKLLHMQWRQLNHDELYHREIARLSVGDKMKHMTLHLSKYLGNLVEAAEANDNPRIEREIVDAVIIVTAAANTVNLNFSRALGAIVGQAGSFRELGLSVSSEGRSGDPYRWLINQLAIKIGRLAKATESLDHVEAYPFRERMQEYLIDLYKILISEAALRQLDIEARIEGRLDSIRSRHVFDRFMRPSLPLR
jgi:hypothetical protein